MPKPIPGKQYTVRDENTLSQIALRAYGRADYWPRIWSANQSALRSGDPDLIFPGEVIIIPEIPEREAPVTGLEPDLDKITIEVDGLELEMQGKRIVRTMDTMADAWSGRLPWIQGKNPAVDERVKFLAFPPSKAFIGTELMVSGPMYDSGSEVNNSGSVKLLQGYTRTIDLVDSNLKPPYEKNNVTLLQRCRDLARPKGIDVTAVTNTGGPFDRVTAQESEKIGTHLAGLAFQRGVLLSSTPEGNLLILEARTDTVPVATLEEGQPGSESFDMMVSGRELFSVIRAIGQTPFGNTEGIAVDRNIPRSRFKTVRADETMAGDIDAAAHWERSKQYVEALTIPFPVVGFRDPQGDLWRENTPVTLVSPSLHLPDGFGMLIRRVEYIEDQNGQRAILGLIPPQAYTKEELINPWS